MLDEYYVFLEELNDIFKKNITKFKNINIVININNINKSNLNNVLSIIKFSKSYKIPFYLINNYQMSIKYNANGTFLSSDHKQLKRPMLLKKILKLLAWLIISLNTIKRMNSYAKILWSLHYFIIENIL